MKTLSFPANSFGMIDPTKEIQKKIRADIEKSIQENQLFGAQRKLSISLGKRKKNYRNFLSII